MFKIKYDAPNPCKAAQIIRVDFAAVKIRNIFDEHLPANNPIPSINEPLSAVLERFFLLCFLFTSTAIVKPI